jgi:predicted molibdopterin-dependent oxidoreductase YjgC
MNWYKKIEQKCRGNGDWGDCLPVIHARRDEVREKAQAFVEKLGHKLSPFNIMNMAQCLKCGQWVECNNIFAQTAAPDFQGAAVINECTSHLDGGYFHNRDKYPEAPAASKTVL